MSATDSVAPFRVIARTNRGFVLGWHVIGHLKRIPSRGVGVDDAEGVQELSPGWRPCGTLGIGSKSA
jgi:hypothetical protein